MIIQRFNLNLIPNQSPVIVHVNQYDTGTGRLIATLYDGNEPYSPNGTAVIQGTKPDGHGFQYTATLDGNVVTADLTEQMSPVAGDVRAQIVVTESSGVTGTFVFIMRVQPSALPSDADMSESDYPLIEEAIREAQEAVIDSHDNAENSEAWAQGTRGGIPVDPTDPTYKHNAEYWAHQAEGAASGVSTFNGRSGSVLPMVGDYDSEKILLASALHIGGETQDNVQKALEALEDNKADEVMYEEEIHGVNLIPFPYNALAQNLGVTVTVDNNGVITVNGTQGSTFGQYYLSSRFAYDFKLPAGSYIVTGGTSDCYINVSTNNVTGDSSQGSSFLGSDIGSGFNFTLNKLSDMQLILAIKSGTYSNKKIYPMLRKADIEDSTYRPYNPQAIQNQLNAQGVLGAKNLLKNNATSQTINGVTFTVNADKSVTVNGTSTASSTSDCDINYVEITKLGRNPIILTGCPSGGATSTYRLLVRELKSDGTDNPAHLDVGDGVEFTPLETTAKIRVYISIKTGVTVNNLVFKPMIRLASDPDDTYQPYAMTNRELTEKVGVWTTPVSCLVGDTTCTITNSAIHTTSTIKAYSETSSGTPVGYEKIVVTEGQAVITFASALTEAASINLNVLNV